MDKVDNLKTNNANKIYHKQPIRKKYNIKDNPN